MIDTFFDTLEFDDLTVDGPTVSLATFGDLMSIMDGNNRWIYRGSMTTPPCATGVYWNVLSTVYPIKAKHLALFDAQLNRGDLGELDATGNWREAQTYNDEAHFGHYVDKPDSKKGPIAGPLNEVVKTLEMALRWLNRNY